MKMTRKSPTNPSVIPTALPSTGESGVESPYFSVAEAAKYLGYCDRQIRRMVKSGELKARRFGTPKSKLLIRKSDLLPRSTDPSPSATEPGADAGTGPDLFSEPTSGGSRPATSNARVSRDTPLTSSPLAAGKQAHYRAQPATTSSLQGGVSGPANDAPPTTPPTSASRWRGKPLSKN